MMLSWYAVMLADGQNCSTLSFATCVKQTQINGQENFITWRKNGIWMITKVSQVDLWYAPVSLDAFFWILPVLWTSQHVSSETGTVCLGCWHRWCLDRSETVAKNLYISFLSHIDFLHNVNTILHTTVCGQHPCFLQNSEANQFHLSSSRILACVWEAK